MCIINTLLASTLMTNIESLIKTKQLFFYLDCLDKLLDFVSVHKFPRQVPLGSGKKQITASLNCERKNKLQISDFNSFGKS